MPGAIISADAALPAVESVLIIDDSPVQRRHGVELCHAMGVTSVHEAGNGREALAVLDSLVVRKGNARSRACGLAPGL
jgi:PleD family two-component response regulator